MPRERSVREGAIRLVERDLGSAVATALDAVPTAGLPAIRMQGPVAGITTEVARRLATGGTMPASLVAWLSDDVGGLADRFRRAAGCARVNLRLEGVTGDGCSRFHVDAVSLRLVSTYRGPGTQYLPPGWAGALDAAGNPPPGDILAMARGDHAIIGGSRDGLSGLLHRSPPLAGTGLARLFLAIDAA